ncbi:class I SAM-dependent methyltransferase [Prochlorococcus sp. MIT 1011]|uniref:class I SAM-dependent methyltransferase n=1 Tax=Prochlorococcus sp. MIT 1011 TaxID=3082520 RepID=UPI0039B6E561
MDSDFYLEFENNFRGSREQIMQVHSNYDGLLDYILNIDKNPSLLDIGSGRGEWIQKCNEIGFNSIGIELDPKMVNHSRKLNLNIKQGDALFLLDKFSENSFSIVSAFHVIEHMNHSNIKELIKKSRRILKSDGLLILETPSIDNLLVATKSFHIDPTHINPIHPDLLAFMIKRSGFTKLKYYFINGGPLQNSDHDKLTRVFNGVAQDLVLIASKSNILDNAIFNDSNLLKRDMRLGITTLDAAIDFDNYSSNRYAHYDEAIFLMRKRILELERQVQKLITLHENSYLSTMRSKIQKIKRKIIYFNSRFKNKLISICRYFYNSNFYKLSIRKLYKIKSLFFFLRYIERILDKYGVRIYQHKFSRKSKHLKEDLEMVLKNDKKLEIYFDKSEDAQTIFNDLNKYS